MKKLLKKVLFHKKEKVLTQDQLALLISRLCDPSDVIYDEEFANGVWEEYETRTSK
jgi:hypothetical protein